MPTWLRRLARLAGGALWLLAAMAGAIEPTRLVDNLRDPAALAVREGPLGGYRVVVAEVGASRHLELSVLGQALLSRREIAPIDGPRPVGLACYGGRLLVFDDLGLSLVPLEKGGSGARSPAGLVPVGPPAVSDSWFFAPGADGLLRGLLAANRVGELANSPTPDGKPVAVALSPEGHAVLLLRDGEREPHRLAFFDPDHPARALATLPVAGLVRPTALVYAGARSGATLLSLEAGGESPGLYRVVRTIEGPARAELLAEIAEPTALVVAPNGAPLVATRGGELLRYDNLFPTDED